MVGATNTWIKVTCDMKLSELAHKLRLGTTYLRSLEEGEHAMP